MERWMRTRGTAVAAMLAALLVPTAVLATDAACGGSPIASGVALASSAETLDHGALLPQIDLVRGGPHAVRLAGVLLPAVADAAVRRDLAAAIAATAGRPLVVHGETAALDRRSRVVGQVVTNGVWLQESLLAQGLVVMDGTAGDCVARLSAAEAQARRIGAGIWSRSGAVRAADRAATGLPDFILAEGRVLTVGKAGRTTYLNFGRRFRTDLTVVIPGRTLAGFPPEKDPQTLAGRTVRVRGWARPVDGVEIVLADESALEILAEDERTVER